MTFFGKSCFGNANKDMPSVTLEVADGKNRSDTACRPGLPMKLFWPYVLMKKVIMYTSP